MTVEDIANSVAFSTLCPFHGAKDKRKVCDNREAECFSCFFERVAAAPSNGNGNLENNKQIGELNGSQQ